ncbi:protease complex subunit PrcB family protein, partial [bacterium]|nr:protease complex subunit PrcB family protein [bacterium]
TAPINVPINTPAEPADPMDMMLSMPEEAVDTKSRAVGAEPTSMDGKADSVATLSDEVFEEDDEELRARGSVLGGGAVRPSYGFGFPAPARHASPLTTVSARGESGYDIADNEATPPIVKSGTAMPPATEAAMRSEREDNLAGMRSVAGTSAAMHLKAKTAAAQRGGEASGAGAKKKATASAEEDADPSSAGLRLVYATHGNYSGWTRSGSKVIRNQAEFKALWDRIHSLQIQPPPMPVVDFSRQIVIAYAMGTRNSGGYWVRLENARREGNELFVTVNAHEPERGEGMTMALTQPFALQVYDVGPDAASIKVRWEK